MLSKLFKAKKNQASELDAETAALLKTIEKRSKEDPLAGAKVGGKAVLWRLIEGTENERGVHIESLLCTLGALAGYACQANLRAQAQAKGLAEEAVFDTVKGKDGRTYFFGELLDNALVGARYSVWGLVGAAAQRAGAKNIPDIQEILAHTHSAVGSPQFGVPRVPAQHQASNLPIQYLKSLWPGLFPSIQLFCPGPAHWPILFGISIQEAIHTGTAVLTPDLSLKIVMESAIPMSKVDLN